jgi:hypothetical protein
VDDPKTEVYVEAACILLRPDSVVQDFLRGRTDGCQFFREIPRTLSGQALRGASSLDQLPRTNFRMPLTETARMDKQNLAQYTF